MTEYCVNCNVGLCEVVAVNGLRALNIHLHCTYTVKEETVEVDSTTDTILYYGAHNIVPYADTVRVIKK